MGNRILFNLIPTQPLKSKRHGGGRYGEVVIDYIITHHLSVVCVYDSNKWFNPHIKNLLAESNIKLYDINYFSIEEIIAKEDVETYYTPILSKGTIGDWNCKLVGTIHGLRSIEMPADFMFCRYKGFKSIIEYIVYRFFGKWYRKLQSEKLKRIIYRNNFYAITVSNFSAHSIITQMPNLKKQIPVFYSPSTDTKNEIGSRVYKEKFFLIVSAFVPFKNGLRALIALDKLFSKGFYRNYRVKVTGISDHRLYRYPFGNIDRFDFLGFVDDNALEQLYHDAYCLLYPSLNEGFGYPPIEAMRYGTPVVASNMTSIPEICGDAAVYIDPYSIDDIMDKIVYIMDDKVYDELKRKSYDRYLEIHKKQENDLERLVHYIYNV